MTWTFSWLFPLPLLSSHRSWQPGFQRASDKRGSPQPANLPPLCFQTKLGSEHTSQQFIFSFFLFFLNVQFVLLLSSFFFPQIHGWKTQVSKLLNSYRFYIKTKKRRVTITESRCRHLKSRAAELWLVFAHRAGRTEKSFHCSDRENDSNLHHGIYSQMCRVLCMQAECSL